MKNCLTLLSLILLSSTSYAYTVTEPNIGTFPVYYCTTGKYTYYIVCGDEDHEIHTSDVAKCEGYSHSEPNDCKDFEDCVNKSQNDCKTLEKE